MRLLTAAFLLVLGVQFAFAQKPVGTYTISYVNKEFEVTASTDKKGDLNLYIDGYSLDKFSDKGGLKVDQKNYVSFVDNLIIAKEKYIEWSKTATENTVKSLDKDIPGIKKQKLTGYFIYNDWEFDFGVNPTYRFKVMEDGEHVLIIRTGKMTSSSNQYIDSDGVVYIFSSVEEIDDFLETISLAYANKVLNQKAATKDLFN